MTNLFQNANRIVIKVGSSFIVDPNSKVVNHEWLDSFIDDVARLKNEGKQIIIVSSGAIALGANILRINPLKLKLQDKQNTAVVGQVQLINLYNKSLARHNVQAAQVLLTIEDLENRKRISAIKTTIDFLLDKNIVPIVNENDLIANTEIRFGDNDRLSARISQISESNLLVLFSLEDGLYTADPNVETKYQFISEVSEISSDLESMASDSIQRTGGMSAKIVSAKIAFNNNCNAIIANGTYQHPIKRIIDGAKCTRFVIDPNSTTKYKLERW